MLQRIEQHNARQPPEQKIRVSVEVEKPREELFQLFGYGDVVSVPCSFSLPHPANLVLKKPEHCLVLPIMPGTASYSWFGGLGRKWTEQRGRPPALGSGAGPGSSQGVSLSQ